MLDHNFALPLYHTPSNFCTIPACPCCFLFCSTRSSNTGGKERKYAKTWARQVKLAMWTDSWHHLKLRGERKKKKEPCNTQFSYRCRGHNLACYCHILPSQIWLTRHTHKLCPVLAHFPTATSSCRAIIKPLYGKW